MQTFVLGQEVLHKGANWLVVRIDNATSIFENEDGTLSKVEESYVQLRGWNGDFDFVGLYEKEDTFTRISTIKALPRVPWRVKK